MDEWITMPMEMPIFCKARIFRGANPKSLRLKPPPAEARKSTLASSGWFWPQPHTAWGLGWLPSGEASASG